MGTIDFRLGEIVPTRSASKPHVYDHLDAEGEAKDYDPVIALRIVGICKIGRYFCARTIKCSFLGHLSGPLVKRDVILQVIVHGDNSFICNEYSRR